MRVMIARVIVSQKESQVDEYLKKEMGGGALMEVIEAGEGGVRLAELREWLKKSYLRGQEKKGVIFLIRGADNLSTECQNTLLKPLEEPVEGTSYVLTVKSTSKLLPTIVSRCVKIDLSQGEEREKIKDEEWRKLSGAWQGDLADCVTLIEDLSKQDVGLVLEEVIDKLRGGLRKWPSRARTKMVEVSLECYRAWQVRVNKKLVLGRLILEGWRLINLDK